MQSYYQKLADECLLLDEYMALKKNFRQDKNKKYLESTPTYEDDDALIDWDQDKFTRFRTFSIK